MVELDRFEKEKRLQREVENYFRDMMEDEYEMLIIHKPNDPLI